MHTGKWHKHYWLLALYALTIGTAVCLVCFYEQLPLILCPFRLLTGIPCPGCGGIRAANALLHGEILKALYINPLSCLLILFCALLPFLYWYDIAKGTTYINRIFFHPWNKKATAIAFTTILLNWIWNLYKYL